MKEKVNTKNAPDTMNQKTSNNSICKQHMGLVKDIEHLQGSDKSQWTEINAMKTRSLVILTGVIVTLLGVVANLVVALVR